MAIETDVQKAREELRRKPLRQIQAETAYVWACRAVAARQLTVEFDSSAFSHDAVEYEHEAIEHAALTGDDEVLRGIRQVLSGVVGG